MEAELKSKGFQTTEEHCLGYCGDCMFEAIAIVDGNFCTEEELEELLD